MSAKLDGAIWHLRHKIVVVIVLFVMAVTGCASRDGSLSADAGSSRSSPSVAEAEGLLDEIASGMRGTMAQTDAVRFLNHVGFQGLIIDCMASRGFIYRGEPAFRVPSRIARVGGGVLDPVAPDAVEADGLGLNATLAGIVENAKAGEPIVRDTSGMDGPLRPEYDVPGWDEALSECEPTEEELNDWVDHPSYDRAAPFTDLVTGVLEGEPVREAAAAYPECMRQAGWPVKDRYELITQVRGGFETLLIDSTASSSADPVERAADVDDIVGSAEWSDLGETRARAASADAACRRDAHGLAFAALLEPLRRFKAEHRVEIEQLRAEWAAIEERARQVQDPALR